MKPIKPAQTRHAIIVNGSPARATVAVRPRRRLDGRQASAVIWIVLASLVGVLVSQLTAIGGEPKYEVSDLAPFKTVEPIRTRWTMRETEFALTSSGIAQFDRIQRDSERRHHCDRVIAQETAKATPEGDRRPAKETPTPGDRRIADVSPTDSATQLAWLAFPENAIPGVVQRVVHSFSELMTPVHVRPLTTEAVQSPRIIRTRPPLLRVAEHSVMMIEPNTGASRENETEHRPAEQPHSIVQARPESASPRAVHPELLQPDSIRGEVSQEAAKLAAKWPFDRIEVSNPSSVTLNVDDADVRTVFEMLARGYQMNILVAPDVKGAVTANVDGLTPEQTLHGIVKMCGLSMQEDDDMIYIYSADNIPADARQLRVFPLDFARAETLEATVQGLLSPVGNAYASKLDDSDNKRTQESIVVVDIPPVIAQVEDYILQADLAPRQVLIEARVLEVELSDDMVHGVNFGSILGGDVTIGSYGLADSVTSASNPVFFARFNGSRLGALIDLLETTTDSKTLAAPRVQVINGQNARIQVGQQLGFTVATVTQTSTIQDIQFLETGVVLSVTPTISRDNRVMMEVKPEVSNGEINPNTLLPEEETREVETSVLLDNHEGVIIGGLIQEKDRTVIKKLPWLGDINYVGKLSSGVKRFARERR